MNTFAGLRPAASRIARTSSAVLCHALAGGQAHAAAEEICRAWPQARIAAQLGGLVAQRAVNQSVVYGVRQAVVLGPGIIGPGAGVHAMLHVAAGCDARVVYVDQDPTAIASIERVAAIAPWVHAVRADVTGVEQVRDAIAATGGIEFAEPLLLFAAGVFDHLRPETATATARGYREIAPAGSIFALTHYTPSLPQVGRDTAVQLYQQATGARLVARNQDDVIDLLTGPSPEWELLGKVVSAGELHPDDPDGSYRRAGRCVLAGMSRRVSDAPPRT